MLEIDSLEDIAALRESVEVECKLAQGRNGDGALPKDFWPTYSAFANTDGGDVFLGIRERSDGRFELAGLADPQKVVDELWTGVNNPQKVSANVLRPDGVQVIEIDGLSIVRVRVPAASRKLKPVFLNNNPLTGTYRRFNSTDSRLDKEKVRRMLAEQGEDERDARILPGFGWEDIDRESFRVYRQMLKDARPGHPFLEYDDFELLKKLRGWRRDRSSDEEGLTLAGLLMFGSWDAIQEGVPGYFVDYQERPEAKTELRWIYRLEPDGSWSGNVFDFYRRVYRKLTEDLRVPFNLEDGQRREDSPVHQALREALVNTLVHADYMGDVSVLVVKRPDMFGFRNPGNMRIPLQDAIQGGLSDCRNRIMHQMFLMIGLGERAGSGIPKIYSGWDWRHWRRPALYEKHEPDQTLLELRMLELFPEGVMEQLGEMFGREFTQLPKLERLILATVATEQVTSHSRVCEITTNHARDVTEAFRHLVRHQFLIPSGHGRGMVYHLPGERLPTPEEVFGGSIPGAKAGSGQGGLPARRGGDNASSPASPVYTGGSSVDSGTSSVYNEGRSVDSSHPDGRGESDQYGRLISPNLPAPMVHDLEALAPHFREALEAQAELPRRKGRVDPAEMERVIEQLCTGHFVTRSCLAKLLRRNPDTLRNQYLKQMLRERRLVQAFPQVPTHGMQAYMAVDTDTAAED